MADDAQGTVDLENQLVKDAIAAAVAAEVDGLKKKNGELIAKNKTLTDEVGAFKTQFDGFDVNAVKALLAKAGTDEDTKLIAEGKFDEVLNKRTEAMRAAHTKEQKKESELRASLEASNAKLRARALAGAVQEVATKANVVPSALDDVAIQAQQIFSLNDDGEAVAKDKFDANGDPLTLAKWIDSLREAKPHWWPRAHGTGANTGAGSGGGTTAKSWADAKTPAEKAALLASKGVGRPA